MKKSLVIIWILVAILFIISSSFTVYSLYLNFKGSGENGLIVQDVTVHDIAGAAGSTLSPIYSSSIITFSSSLLLPNDSITYKVTYNNKSNKDIVLKNFEKSVPESSDIKFELSGANEGDIVSRNGSFNLFVKISYDSNSKGNSAINTNLTVKVDYDEK